MRLGGQTQLLVYDGIVRGAVIPQGGREVGVRIDAVLRPSVGEPGVGEGSLDGGVGLEGAYWSGTANGNRRRRRRQRPSGGRAHFRPRPLHRQGWRVSSTLLREVVHSVVRRSDYVEVHVTSARNSRRHICLSPGADDRRYREAGDDAADGGGV